MKTTYLTLLILFLVSLVFGQQYIINESFEGTWLPSGWTNSGFARAAVGRTGTYSASSGQTGNYLITPLITVPSTLSYWNRKKTGNCTFSIQTSSSVNGPWTTVSGYPISAGNGWSNQTYDFSSYSNIYVRFLHVSNNNIWYLDDIQITLATPSIQVSAINFSGISGKQVTINWTNGNGNGRAIFLKEASAGSPGNPIDGINYTASTDWTAKGTQLGSTGYYCVYNGNGSSVTVSQLNPDTGYYVVAYEYNSYGGSYTFVTGGATGSISTKTSSETDYFRTITTGSWNDTETWETSPNNTTWYTSCLVPTSNAVAVIIRTGHTVTLTDNASCSLLNFRGGTIKLGNYNLNITNTFDGTPYYIYNGTGVPSQTGNLANVTVTTIAPTSLPNNLCSLTVDCGTDNFTSLTNSVTTTDITFVSGGIILNNYNLTVSGSVSGTPYLDFNGTGVATGLGNSSYSDISDPYPADIPPIVYDLEVDLGEGNIAYLPNDVELTTFTITSGSLNLNNHKLTFTEHDFALSSTDAVISALNISVSNYKVTPQITESDSGTN